MVMILEEQPLSSTRTLSNFYMYKYKNLSEKYIFCAPVPAGDMLDLVARNNQLQLL